MREEGGFLPEEELNQFWNALVARGNRSAVAPASLDPATAETIRRLSRLGASPAPASSRERVQRGIREQLLLRDPGEAEGCDPMLTAPVRPLPAHRELPAVERSPWFSSNGRGRDAAHSENGWAPDPLARARTASRHSFVAPARVAIHVAAVIVLVIVVASAAVALLYPLRLWEVGQRAFVAGSTTASGERALTGETTLLDLTLTDIPTYRAQLGMYFATIPPGSTTEQHSGAGPQLFYVAEGSVTVRARTAPEPLWVVPPESDDRHPAKDLIAQGDQATVETGATLLVPKGAVVDLFTRGATAARVVLLFAATDNRSFDDGVNWQFATNGGMITLLATPISINLRQGSLEPYATIPAPASDGTHQIMAPLEARRMGDLRSGTGGTVRNAGKQPVDLYLLTVTAASP
jgi:hypothetical protein